MSNVMLGVPSHRGGFPTEYVKSLWSFNLTGNATWLPVEGLAVDVARNLIVSQFLQSNNDYLLMHDSDAVWHPDAIMRLLSLDLPVVSAVIYQRRFPTVPFIGRLDQIKENGDFLYSFVHAAGQVIDVALRNQYEPPDSEVLPPLFEEDVVETIDACGSHFVLIRRDVLESIEPPYYQITHPPNAGEDFYFCRKVKEAGFDLYVNYSVHTGHVAGEGVVIGLREFFIYSYLKEQMNA